MAEVNCIIYIVDVPLIHVSGCLAQLVERRPYKANVGGSIPSAPTNVRSGSSVG